MSNQRGLLICTQVVDERDENLGFFVSWLRAFAASGRPIFVLAWRADLTTSFPANVDVTVLPEGKLRRTLALWAFSWKHRRDVQSVFVHMLAPLVVASGWLWRVLGWKVTLWYTHGDVPWTLRVAEFFVHQIFTATADSCRLDTPKKIVTGHGIDLERYRPFNVPRRPILITVGRIAPRKDLLAFVKLCTRLREGGTAFSALVVGEPRLESDRAYAQAVRDTVVANGLEQVVHLVGSQTGDELVRTYSESALFVSASRTGSLDKAVLESLACATPVIAVGESFRGFPGVTIVPDVSGDEALVLARTALEQTMAHPEARAGVAERANLKNLIQRLESILYAV